MTTEARLRRVDALLDRAGGALLAVVRWAFYVAATLWAAGAVYVDGPLDERAANGWLAAAWLALAIACLALARTLWWRVIIWGACFALVLVPWLGIEPSNDREWKPDWAETGHAALHGEVLTFHNLRNFDYAVDGTARERWESRQVRLSNLRGVDFFHVPFGGDYIAHPIISFDFGPDGRIALSVETRREVGEGFSTIGGLYKMFELQYLFADERDVIRVRTNVRDEPVYLYRSTLTPEQALLVLLDSVRMMELLRESPRFYNVLTANCTTSLLTQSLELRNAPFDIRMLANGRFDELLVERGVIRTDTESFEEARERAFVNDVAQAAHDAADFSERIRAGRPGFD